MLTSNQEIYPTKGDLLVILIDDSHSMSEKFQDNSLLHNKMVEIGDMSRFFEFPIELKIQYSTKPNQIEEYGKIGNQENLQKILTQISVSSSEAKLNESLIKISEHITENNILNAKLWVVSDFQERENFDQSLNNLSKSENIQTTLFPIQHPGINNAISEVVFPKQIMEVNKNILIKSSINYWQEFHESKISLFIDGQRVAQDITKDDNNTIDFEFAPLKTGTISGYLSLADDDLLKDNKYYFSLDIPEKLNLLMVSRQVENSILEKAITAGKESLLKVTNISPEILAMENLDEYDVLIFHSVSQLSDSYVSRLNDFLEDGKGIVYLPGINTSTEEYNNFWHKKMGLPKWKSNLSGDGKNYVKLNNINTSHPIFSQIWQDKETFKATSQFFALPDFERNGNVLIDYTGGSPFLTETSDRKLLLISTFLSPNESNLQLTGFFPVLMQQTVLYLANYNKSMANQFVGDTLRHSHFDMENIAKFTMKTPDNRSYLMEIDKTQNQLLFADTKLPGFYKLYFEDKMVRQFALNICKNETVGKFLDIEELQKDKIAIYNEIKTETGQESNKEMNAMILMLIILLLLVETVIARINRK